VALLCPKARGVRKIVTECPHCFSTLKNDYRQFGVELEVVHYTQLIHQLLADGKLRMKEGADPGRLVFHDSCYLARHNGVIDEPRSILSSVTGQTPVEMPRNRENAFCCGAGGGRMWMEEDLGMRINVERVKEALEAKAETLCVCCPYCLTMMEDGLKDLNAHDRVQLKDLAEIVADRLAEPAGNSAPRP
jgi:Fe-S oxidoreductase